MFYTWMLAVLAVSVLLHCPLAAFAQVPFADSLIKIPDTSDPYFLSQVALFAEEEGEVW